MKNYISLFSRKRVQFSWETAFARKSFAFTQIKAQKYTLFHRNTNTKVSLGKATFLQANSFLRNIGFAIDNYYIEEMQMFCEQTQFLRKGRSFES